MHYDITHHIHYTIYMYAIISVSCTSGFMKGKQILYVSDLSTLKILFFTSGLYRT